MPNVITRRIATEADTEFARNVHHKAMYDVVMKQFGSWGEKSQDKWFYGGWLPVPNEIILADGVPCGYCSIEFTPEYAVINEILLLPEYQGKGIGTQIINEVIKEAKEKKMPVKLQVLKENRAQNLYRRLGFKDTGTTETHFQMMLS